jgi:hypothetical protein
MKHFMALLTTFVLALGATAARALPGTFMIDEIYSNADGSVQFVVIRDRGQGDCDAQENLWAGQTLLALGPAPVRTFVFPSNLPTCATSGKRVLIATQSFAALGLVTPDYVIPDGFIQIPDGGVTFADISHVSYTNLPSDGVHAISGSGATVQNVATNLAGDSVSVTPSNGPDINQHGLTGSWYEPATSGQGFEVEIYPDLSSPGTGLAQLSWFTFDKTAGGADHQRWYTLTGPVMTGRTSASLTIAQNTGGNFNGPPTTSAFPVGFATLAFDSCSTGLLTYNFTDGSGLSGAIPLSRITQNVTCSTTSTRPTNADFALSGNWYDPATTGQGFTVEANEASATLFFAWYTYAPNGAAAGAAGQRWFTGQGPFAAGMRSIPVTLVETTGGAFDSSAAAAHSVAVGTATLAFQSCTHATLSYAFTGGSSSGRSGLINLSRIGPVPKGCE